MPQRCFAYIGLVVFVAHAVYRAIVKSMLNDWYGDFYETAGNAATVNDSNIQTNRSEMVHLLYKFAQIAMPSVIINPLVRFLLSRWQLAWRISLMKSYLGQWDVTATPIEGAAQRVHEDSKRFEEGVSGCLSTLLDAIFTLLVFAPVLVKLGAHVRPAGITFDAWLLLIALGSASGGLLVSAVVGRKLVVLEVKNQKIEAQLRTSLVILAETPSILCGPKSTGPAELEHISPVNAMADIFDKLYHNYRRLYTQFMGMNIWLSLYDQINSILPYLLTAPLLFAVNVEHRISLGVLVKVSNAFSKVFESLAILSENWTAVNAFRAVVHRLLEFESVLYGTSLISKQQSHTELVSSTD